MPDAKIHTEITTMNKFTAVQATALNKLLTEASSLELATSNNRTAAFKKLSELYVSTKAPDMPTFKAALSSQLKMRFGKESKDSKGFVPAPQIVKDWCSRYAQASALGITAAKLKNKTESQVKAAIVTETAVSKGMDRAKLKAKAGTKPTLKSTQLAVKALSNPNLEVERAKLKECLKAMQKTMAELDHAGRMAYMTSLLTQVKGKPESQVRGEAA